MSTRQRVYGRSFAVRRNTLICNTFLTFFIFRDQLHMFVGQSCPSFPCIGCFQPCQLSFHIFSYFFISSPILSSHLRIAPPRLIFSVSILLLRGCLLLLTSCVHTHLFFSVSGMLTFGILVWPGFRHGPVWSYPLSDELQTIILDEAVTNLRYLIVDLQKDRWYQCDVCQRLLPGDSDRVC